MIRAQRGLLERLSLEDSALVAEGEDLSSSCRCYSLLFEISSNVIFAGHAVPVFPRPAPTSRPRSSTCTSSSGADTPSLTSYDSSSQSEGSHSSIDLSSLNIVLSNATHPMASGARARAKARARGHGHRKRTSHTRVSKSYYGTIKEEMSSAF
jgi:serine/arginine repetitive matrix protein 2